MKMHSAQNERIKRAYFTYLAEAKGFSEATLDAVAKALNRFESYTRFRDFKAFHIEQAKGFKASLAEQMSLRTKDRLSKATLDGVAKALNRSRPTPNSATSRRSTSSRPRASRRASPNK